MAPYPSPTQPTSSTLSASPGTPQDPQTGLPGIKRGIAIGVACSLTVIIIAFVAFLAIRRRNKISSQRQQANTGPAENPQVEAWSQEKLLRITAPLPPLPPVEADAGTIYELDANQTPELPGSMYIPEMEADIQCRRTSPYGGEENAHTQKLDQWKPSGLALERPNEMPGRTNANLRLPLLTISTPRGSYGNISPLWVSPRDPSSRNTSLICVSPLPDAHLPSNHNQSWI